MARRSTGTGLRLGLSAGEQAWDRRCGQCPCRSRGPPSALQSFLLRSLPPPFHLEIILFMGLDQPRRVNTQLTFLYLLYTELPHPVAGRSFSRALSSDVSLARGPARLPGWVGPRRGAHSAATVPAVGPRLASSEVPGLASATPWRGSEWPPGTLWGHLPLAP